MIYIERILWAMATVMLLASGLYFTFKLNFVQFKIKDMLESFKKSNRDV
jgi:Na+/alanine symporter